METTFKIQNRILWTTLTMTAAIFLRMLFEIWSAG